MLIFYLDRNQALKWSHKPPSQLDFVPIESEGQTPIVNKFAVNQTSPLLSKLNTLIIEVKMNSR